MSHISQTSSKRLLRSYLGLCLSWVVLGCTGDRITTLEAMDVDPIHLYARLTLEHKGIILSRHAPYDTVQLRAMPRNLHGDILSYTGTIEYRRVNPLDTSVMVDSTGFVTVRANTSGARIEARLTINGVMRSDTATILVRNESPVVPVDRMEFFPVAPDSNWRWAGSNASGIGYEAWVRLFAANGTSISTSQVPITYSWDNDRVMQDDGWSALYGGPSIIGETYIHARLYAYGKTFSDSVLLRRIEPTVKFIVIGREVPLNGSPKHRFYPDSVTVKAGTTIIFANGRGFFEFACNSQAFCGNRIISSRAFTGSTLEWVDSTDVVFDNPAGASVGTSFGRIMVAPLNSTVLWPADGGAGNIPAFGIVRCVRQTSPHDGCGGRISPTVTVPNTTLDRGYRSRMFNTPGTYRFHSTRFAGATGVIVVE